MAFKFVQQIVYVGSKLDPVDSKINSFVGYEGVITDHTVSEALFWRRQILEAGFTSVEAFPGDDGEILISGIQGAFSFEVIIEHDQKLTGYFTKNDLELVRFNSVDKETAIHNLQQAAFTLWTLFGGLKAINTIPVKSASLASPLESPLTVPCL